MSRGGFHLDRMLTGSVSGATVALVEDGEGYADAGERTIRPTLPMIPARGASRGNPPASGAELLSDRRAA